MSYNIAVIGATGKVGRELLNILSERKFPINKIYPLDTSRPAGRQISFGEEVLTVAELDDFDFSRVEFAIFATDNEISRDYVPQAADSGCTVIDNSSYFKMQHDVPLIIPEVNAPLLKNAQIIANPSCSTIQLATAITPLHNNIAEIENIVVSTYQSVSEANIAGMDELYSQTKSKFMNDNIAPKCFNKTIAFNLIPQIGEILENGCTQAEQEIELETKKILSDDITLSATCVRVPTFVGNCESVHLTFKNTVDLEQVYNKLENAVGVRFTDTHITPHDCVGKDNIYISRLRQNHHRALNMWLLTDNLRKGSALNIVQILDALI